MGIEYWTCAPVAIVAAIAGWRYLRRPYADWKPLEERLGDQVTVSATLARECAQSNTSYAGLSTTL